MNKKVLVFGSFVVDLMARSPHLPVPGETVKGSLFKMGPGGKGFNQGVAAHKAGADVTMVTKIGNDTFGRLALDEMKALGMNAEHIMISEQTETGAALIMVDENISQNEIVVVLGACGTITDSEVKNLADLLDNTDYLLLQLETNLSSIEKIIDLAHQKGVTIILNTAPVQVISDQLLQKVDIITPNEVEAQILSGIEIKDLASANQAYEWFKAKGVSNLIITLGHRGVYVGTDQVQTIIDAYSVQAIDTTGAGDAFNGGFVAKLSTGASLIEAVKYANAVAALSVQKMGTTKSMPTQAEIDSFINQNQS